MGLGLGLGLANPKPNPNPNPNPTLTLTPHQTNTTQGDSFIPYPGCSLAGHTACAVDSSSLIIFGGNLETVAGFEQVSTSPLQPGPGPEPEPEPEP